MEDMMKNLSENMPKSAGLTEEQKKAKEEEKKAREERKAERERRKNSWFNWDFMKNEEFPYWKSLRYVYFCIFLSLISMIVGCGVTRLMSLDSKAREKKPRR